MADLDVMFAGGATGAMTRAAQMQALAASNAQAAASRLITRRQATPPVRQPPRAPARSRADIREDRPEFRRPLPPEQVLPFSNYLTKMREQKPSVAGPGGIRDSDDRREDRPEFKRPAAPPMVDPEQQLRDQRFADWRESRPGAGGPKGLQSESSVNRTIQAMVDDVMQDPMADSGRQLAVQEMANAFREKSRYRFFTPDEIIDNPLLRTINDVAAWSRYRKMVADWHAQKAKVGDTANASDAGDGTFVGIIENGSFGSEKSPSALPPYVVARDENGMLTVIKAAQWFQGKYTDMKKDPRFAAQVITALAQTSMYGSDTTANAQASRVAVDRNGNPIKAIAGMEDLNALAALANQVVIFQTNGDETAIDDVLAQLTVVGQQVSAQNKANGEQGGGGSGGGGGGRRFGGGFGGGGSGGGSVRYTDPEQLKSLADSIGRQRMGRSLTPGEQAAFVAFYHQQEAAQWSAFQAGQPFVDLDPQSQAVAWVQNHFQSESAAQEYGRLAATFVSMMGTSNPFGAITS